MMTTQLQRHDDDTTPTSQQNPKSGKSYGTHDTRHTGYCSRMASDNNTQRQRCLPKQSIFDWTIRWFEYPRYKETADQSYHVMSRKRSCHSTTTTTITTTSLFAIFTLRLFLLIHVLFYFYPPTITAMANSHTNTRTLLSKCACGSVRVEIPFDALNEVPTVDCHCPACRKYHVAGLVRYLVASATQKVSILSNNGSQPPSLLHYQEYCQQLGHVERIQCETCASKLVTRPLEGDDDSNNNKLFVNMGPLVEDSIPTDLITYWTLQQPEQWQTASKVTWTNARPSTTTRTSSNTEEYSTTRRIRGGCACGKCRYEVDWEEPTELQHCYCKLCRRLSGGVYMTWTPVWKEDLRWLHVPTAAEQQQEEGKKESNQAAQDEQQQETTTSFTAPGSSSRYLQMLSSPRRSPLPPSIQEQQQQLTS